MEQETIKKIKWYNINKKIALISGIFALLLSTLLIVNYIQIKSVDPLNSEAINRLMLQLEENPNDEALKEQIRALDLLARKAYFTNQWQIDSGGLLLFIFVIIFLSSLKYLNSSRKYLPDLEKNPNTAESWEQKLLARKYTMFSGLALFAAAFALVVFSQSEMLQSETAGTADNTNDADFPSIEEIRKNWPGFRGPEGIGIAYNINVPVEWNGSEGKNIVWKTVLPLPGFNSPIVWGDKIFLSGADKKSQAVFCIDAPSGKIIWRTDLNDISEFSKKRPKVIEDTGFAAPTMTTDGKLVFVLFSNGDLACLDFDGKKVWSKNLGMPENHYGHSSSLITYQNLLLIQYDQNTTRQLIALNTESGETAYVKPRDIKISWASPILVNTGERMELILNSMPHLISYDPLSGQELWRVKCMSGEVGPSPAYADGWVFAANEYARLAAVKLDGSPEVDWQDDEELPDASSPLAVKDFVFVATSYGTISCYNSKTGENYWIEEFDEGFYSSPIAAGDNVYLLDMNGDMIIFKAAEEYQLIAQNELGEKAVTIPAFMHNRIYIRGKKHLICIGEDI